jgi:hypothetical protein
MPIIGTAIYGFGEFYANGTRRWWADISPGVLAMMTTLYVPLCHVLQAAKLTCFPACRFRCTW